jgi:hypothetical protein
MWIVQLRRIFREVSSLDTFEVRPAEARKKPFGKSLETKETGRMGIAYHSRAKSPAAVDISTLKFQNYIMPDI